MPNEIYEVVAQAARYWFLFLMALIAWRSYRWLMRDRKQRRKRLKLLPDAGFVGELVVVKGSRELPIGIALPVSKEGILGSVRGDDVFVPVAGVAKRHLWFAFDEDRGLYVEPYGRCPMEVDGLTPENRTRHAYLTHGSRLTVGEAEFRLRMFAGFELAGVAVARAADFDDAPSELAVMPDAQVAAGVQVGSDAQAVALQQAQWLAALQQAQTFTPAQVALLGQMGLLSPQGVPLMTPEQLQAMLMAGHFTPRQAVALWQAGQYSPEQMAALQAVSNPTSKISQSKAESLLNIGNGVFMPPPKVSAGGAILTQELSSMTEDDAPSTDPTQEQTAYARQRYRTNPLPPMQEQNGEASPELDETSIPDDAFDEPPFPMDAESTLAADALWERAHHGDQARRALDTGLYTPEPSTAEREENATFAPRVTFYPPVPDGTADEGLLPEGFIPADADETWPYAVYPEPDVSLGDNGYTYPEIIEPQAQVPVPDDIDEPYEYADEDEAPRSLYVEPDEAAKAKRLLWDRYLKGGHER